MLKQFVLMAVLVLPVVAGAQLTNIAKVSVLSSGKTLLNGREANLAKIEAEFKRLKNTKGTVWYYREDGQSEPRPEAMAVIRLVADNGLAVSMSSKPDFSDYIDDKGDSHPRKP
jgi:hypothetical protein